MKIEIVTKNVTNDAMVREFIQRKVYFALDRVTAQVMHVTVRLEDESSDSAAFDGLCQIDVTLKSAAQIHVSANGKSAFDSVLQAVRKMEHAIKHDVDRRRSSSRIRHRQSKQKFYATLENHDL